MMSSSTEKTFSNETEVESILKRSRFNSGKTLEEVSREIGVTKGACFKWENDGLIYFPRISLLDKIIEVYEIEDGIGFREGLKKVKEQNKQRQKLRKSLRFNKKPSPKTYLRESTPPFVFSG